jgi:transcriptional regulator with XRE-family HTH domain
MAEPASSSGSGLVVTVTSHSGYDPPDRVVNTRRRHHSGRPWHVAPSIGHTTGLGYLVLTLRELSGLSQARLAARAGSSQPAIARLESGRQVPTVNTLVRVAEACGLHLVVGLADPDLDVEDICLHDLTLLAVVKPNRLDRLLDFFVVREPPPTAGAG